MKQTIDNLFIEQTILLLYWHKGIKIHACVCKKAIIRTEVKSRLFKHTYLSTFDCAHNQMWRQKSTDWMEEHNYIEIISQL